MLRSVDCQFLYDTMAVCTHTDEGQSSTVEVTLQVFLKYHNEFIYRMRTQMQNGINEHQGLRNLGSLMWFK